ncbi:Sporulation protein RMD8 [Colletotrichum gloeosporioides]|uniref:Sporulation protein RMD8 n=1 Tax=Colletotrichum gloeosporioides TaxID=474922 RepID=A0A8H4FKA5_COLGL|nr:Sporulation protein RMD8 [Colletotrichum gloeosporioides]KAF3805262.1 Sporulation protein RMD8 [Colletotrichum gloeosporioides]
MASAKRGPSVLVTDSRERPPPRGALQRQNTGIGAVQGRPAMRFISVDNVLYHASEIPSGQPRVAPPAPQRSGAVGSSASVAGSRRVSAGPGGGGSSGLPNLQSRTGQQNMPSRTTKISEKLVLLPETDDKPGSDEDLDEEASRMARQMEEEENRPLRDEELDVLRKRGGIRGKSYAERLPKVQRKEKLARLTAYCTAQSYKMQSTAEFLRKKHEAKTKLYDDCLYVIYSLPLLNGNEGYRVRSRPIVKTPGSGKTVLDLEIERSEQRDHHEGYFDEFAYSGSPVNGNGTYDDSLRHREQSPDDGSTSPFARLAPDAKNFAEVFLFSYGVVVFWNFTEYQEKDILADLTFAQNENGLSLITRPLDEDDFETEEFHFEYSADVKRPRIFNDMITLLPRGDHMVKLTISHAIAQSTKLCLFEERMSETMLDAQHVPKRLALTGELNMTRTEIVKILGRLFKSRVDINLSSNILDVPNFFWDSEPTLHPLYVAIREYLEIDPRIKVLNERCRVFLDLAEILADSVADAKMSYITWIIIVLIVISILVTVTEVGLRFGILSKNNGKGGEKADLVAVPLIGAGSGQQQMQLPGSVKWELEKRNVSVEEVRLWSRMLCEEEGEGAKCGGQIIGETYAGV